MKDKVILNKTRSSRERWTYFPGTKELVNGKDRYPMNEFLESDHPMKDTVKGWLVEHEIVMMVETSVPETDSDPLLQSFIKMVIHQHPPGYSRNNAAAEFYTNNNRILGKGSTRRLRKMVRDLDLPDGNHLAGISARSDLYYAA